MLPHDNSSLPGRSTDRPSTAEPTTATLPEDAEMHNFGKAAADSKDDEEGDEEEGEEDEPQLKYAKLTGSLTSVYRNGDGTSAFLVAGDKMVIGTHNGNVDVLELPNMRVLRSYHAHGATISAISISPVPHLPKKGREEDPGGVGVMLSSAQTVASHAVQSARNAGVGSMRAQQASQIPNTPNNAIYIATSSLDGHVCIYSLLDPKDVQLRNFARPLSAVALSPDYKADRTYLSGGKAGQLILTVGGKSGVTVDANTNSAAAAASAWFGLGTHERGKDTSLHSGEGGISAIKWSRSGKWVVWVNEEGIKIMRSHLHLASEHIEDAWKRIAHASRPNRKGWEEMAGVWRPRVDWVDESEVIDQEKDLDSTAERQVNTPRGGKMGSKKSNAIERLVVGWGDTAWILHVIEGGRGPSGQKVVGTADIIHKLQFRDCVISGITLYTPSLLAILAYRTRDDEDRPINQPQEFTGETPSKGRGHRRNGLAPQMRLVDTQSGEEIDLDELSISRFDSLSAQDYHLGSLFVTPPPQAGKSERDNRETEYPRGALEGLRDAAGGKYASRMFSSGANMVSRSSSDKDGREKSTASAAASTKGAPPVPGTKDVHPYAATPGRKLFIQSPFDCILAVRRDMADHLEWIIERQRFDEAWHIIDEHPDILSTTSLEIDDGSNFGPSSPSKGAGAGPDDTLAEFLADDLGVSESGTRAYNAPVQREKRRVGDLWVQQLVSSGQWSEAGRVAGKVLGAGMRWEHWVLAFAQAGKFDEITPFIPSAGVPGVVYEVVLGHYISADPWRLEALLEFWGCDGFDVGSVITAVEARLRDGEVEDGSQEWKRLTESLGKLYLAEGRAREALRCWIRVQDADKAMRLIREEKLVDVVASENVAGLLMLRVSRELLQEASMSELEAASSEVVDLLVEEALRGTLTPATIIPQLEEKGASFRPFLFFYLRALWHGTAVRNGEVPLRRLNFDRRIDEGHALVEDHADLALDVFAEYDRDLLLELLQASSVYSFDHATALCERRHLVPELVYVLAKTGQTRRALSLIIGELGDVRQAIAFARDHQDLWDDLLDYSMDKPAFIHGLLEAGGHEGVDAVELVGRIPEGLEIEGLKAGIQGLVREHDVRVSIAEGAARVFRGEVAVGMATLREGRQRAVKFDMVRDHAPSSHVDRSATKDQAKEHHPHPPRPGHCAACHLVFTPCGTCPLRRLRRRAAHRPH